MKTNLSESELRFWRIYAAIQELCHAEDADLIQDRDLEKFVRLASRAIKTYQDQKQADQCAKMKQQILKEVGIPMIAPRKK